MFRFVLLVWQLDREHRESTAMVDVSKNKTGEKGKKGAAAAGGGDNNRKYGVGDADEDEPEHTALTIKNVVEIGGVYHAEDVGERDRKLTHLTEKTDYSDIEDYPMTHSSASLTIPAKFAEENFGMTPTGSIVGFNRKLKQ